MGHIITGSDYYKNGEKMNSTLINVDMQFENGKEAQDATLSMESEFVARQLLHTGATMISNQGYWIQITSVFIKRLHHGDAEHQLYYFGQYVKKGKKWGTWIPCNSPEEAEANRYDLLHK